MRGGLDAEVRHVVQSINQGHARRACCQNGLDLAYVEIARPEVGEKNDQAALAACFFSPLADSFFSPFFLSSAAGTAPSSARSIRLTSASGALSPLRKPVLRMRRYPPLRLL